MYSLYLSLLAKYQSIQQHWLVPETFGSNESKPCKEAHKVTPSNGALLRYSGHRSSKATSTIVVNKCCASHITSSWIFPGRMS